MKLIAKDLLLLSISAISAACRAGEIITEQAKLTVAVQSKKAGESLASQVVTEVDLLCQKVILKILFPTCEKFDLALLSEEKPDDEMRLQKDYFWCIDPLDGTLPFIEQTAGYAVSIALVSRQGIPQIGVIYDPIEQTLYHAIIGQGAYRNKQSWSLKKTSRLQPLTIMCDRSFVQQSNYTKIINECELIAVELGFDGLKLIQFGGAVMNACWVLENAPGCYFKFPKEMKGGGSLWDFAATACLFKEIGAKVSDIHGDNLDLNRADSFFMNHRGVLFAHNLDLANRIRKSYSRVIRNEIEEIGTEK